MSKTTLFARLERAADPNASGRSVYRSQDLESTVIEHLQRILNTRAGSAPSAPDYGIVEVSELSHDFPDAQSTVQRALKSCIARYEPRLKSVVIRPAERDEEHDDLRIHFEITAQLVYPNGERQPVRFRTSVDHSSNVVVDT